MLFNFNVSKVLPVLSKRQFDAKVIPHDKDNFNSSITKKIALIFRQGRNTYELTKKRMYNAMTNYLICIKKNFDLFFIIVMGMEMQLNESKYTYIVCNSVHGIFEMQIVSKYGNLISPMDN